MSSYTPKVGDSVAARRRVRRKIHTSKSPNLIVGPITEVQEDACTIVCNQETEIEGTFHLPFCDWKFEFLHLTKESENLTLQLEKKRGAKI